MDIWVFFTFWIFWKMLLWTFTYKFLCRHLISLVSWGSSRLFSKVVVPVMFSPAMCSAFSFFTPLGCKASSFCLGSSVGILMGVNCSLSDLDLHFSDDYCWWTPFLVSLLALVYLLWTNTYWDLLPIFKLDLFLFVTDLVKFSFLRVDWCWCLNVRSF